MDTSTFGGGGDVSRYYDMLKLLRFHLWFCVAFIASSFDKKLF